MTRIARGRKVKGTGAAFVQGFAAAAADIYRSYGMRNLARFICEGSGFDLADFEAAGVDEFDMEPLRKAFGPPKRKRSNKA